jgi:hypothetical protein
MANAELDIIIKAKDQASQAMGNIEKSAGGLGSKLTALAGALAAAAAAYVSFSTIKDAIGWTKQLGDAVWKVNYLTGMGAEASSQFIFALHHCGIEADAAAVMIGRFSKNMFSIQVAAEGGDAPSKNIAAALKEIGVNALDASGNIRPLQDMIYDAADAFHVMAAGATKDAIAVTLFGRSGLQMIPLLNMGSQGFKELAAEADKLGVTLTTKNMVAIHQYTLAQRDMSMATGGLKLMIGMELMPVITRLETWFISVQPQVRTFAATVGTDLTNAFNTVKTVISPVTDLLGKMSNRDIIVMVGALAAALTGTLAVAFGVIVVSATAAFIAENAALLGIPALVALAVVAISLLVMHWNQVWAALTAAPAAILDWLKSHWTDVLIGVLVPGGLIIELVKHWNDLFSALPASARAPLIELYNVFVGVFNDITDAVHRALQKVADLINAIPDISIGSIKIGIPDVELPDFGELQKKLVPFTGKVYSGTMDNFIEQSKKAKTAVDDLIPDVGALGDGLGTGLSPAADKATDSLTDAEKGLIALLNAFNVSGLSVAQYTTFLDACQKAMAMFNLTGDQLAAVLQTCGLSAMDFADRIGRLSALQDLTTQAKTAMDAVDELYNAFNRAFAKPTVEEANQNLALAQLKLKRAQLIEEAGSTVSKGEQKKIDKVDAEIAAIQRNIDIRRALQDVDKATLDLADQTKMTDEQQNTAVQMITTAMGTASSNAATLGDTLFWTSLALTVWRDEMQKWVDTVTKSQLGGAGGGKTSQEIYDVLSDEGKRYVDIMAALQSVPSMAGGGVVPGPAGRMQLTRLHGREEVVPAGGRSSRGGFTNYGHLTIQVLTPGDDILEEVQRQLR